MVKATQKDYEKNLAEVQKLVDTFPFKVFGPLVEVCLNEFNITYKKAFPQVETMCVYETIYKEKVIYIMVDEKTMSLRFDIQFCPLDISMPLFAYEEVFEPSTFHDKYELAKRVIDGGFADGRG